MVPVTSRVCLRQDCGLRSVLFGGTMMAWLDENAYVYAKRVTQEKFLVTKKFGELIFKEPVHEGDVVDFYMDNLVIGNTSVSFNIIVKVKSRVVVETSAVFVCVDMLGQKKIIGK